MFEFFDDFGNYATRKVARDVSECGIIVSTCWTSDEGYETALLDSNGTYPVERYLTEEDAMKGHCKWLVFAHDANTKTVKKLGGFEGLVEDEEIILISS